jgi:hypothetical protein
VLVELSLPELGLWTDDLDGVEEDPELSDLGFVTLVRGVELGGDEDRCGLTVERGGGVEEGLSADELSGEELCGRVTVREGGAVGVLSRAGRVVVLPRVCGASEPLRGTTLAPPIESMTRPGTGASLQFLSLLLAAPVAPLELPLELPPRSGCLGCTLRSLQFSEGAVRSAGRWIVRGASRSDVAGLCGRAASPPAAGVREIDSDDGRLWTAGVRVAEPRSTPPSLVAAGVRPTVPSPVRSLGTTREPSRVASVRAEGAAAPPRLTAPGNP